MIKILPIFLLILEFGSLTYGATFTVTKTADTNDGVCDTDCSLREAIAAANAAASDDTIEFSALFNTGRTITLNTGELVVANNGTLGIIGRGATLLGISGARRSRVFFVNGATLPLKGMQIFLGNGAGMNTGLGGGVYNSGGTLNIADVRVNSNEAAFGGGIYSIGAVMLADSVVSSNSSTSGGGIYNVSGSLDVQRSIISNNFVLSANNQDGGGIYNAGGSAVLTVTDSTIRNNSARYGGGIYNVSGTATITNTTITENGAKPAAVSPIMPVSSISTMSPSPGTMSPVRRAAAAVQPETAAHSTHIIRSSPITPLLLICRRILSAQSTRRAIT